MKEDLLGRSTVRRRKAAIFLRKNNLDEDYCDLLLQALKMEEEKSWQTQVEIVKTLGVRRCTRAKVYLQKIIDTSDPYSLLAMASAKAFVRIDRCSLEDCNAVFKLINTDNYSLIVGALEALGYDRMIPSVEQQEKIIEKCQNFGKFRPKGYTDPRYGLAAACAGWDKKMVEDFLNDCLASGDAPLMYVAEKSLQRKYVKLR